MMHRTLWAAVVVLAGAAWVSAGELGAGAVAKRVDALLAKETLGGSDTPLVAAPQTDDATFLRRVSLDLVGGTPTPEELTAYSFDASADKRANAVERLLARREFGQNWARYWRDVILYRRSEERALLVSNTVVSFLSDAFNNDPHWDKIARKFITATGDIRDEGATAIIMAQNANTEDTTAEMSRIFLGIQIQCAQCHNHPTDRWKREQFHELAAFFPRITVRTVRDGEKRSFAVTPVDKARGAKRPGQPNRGNIEHHMPDLNNPEEQGKLMKPVFFATGQKLDAGKTDQERREAIAEWFTAGGNRWFAKAFVNRMWSELVGHGFYEPVDDIGPDRQCAAPQTLDYLADRFAANHYDVKWLVRAITATEAYGRQSKSRVDDGSSPFVAACPQRLRGDQLYNALVEALGIPDPQEPGGGYRAPRGPRSMVNATFGYDPSVRRDEIAGSIPQALFLMNAPELARAIDARQERTTLGKLLKQIPDDEALVGELYLRTLAREPKKTELQTCLDYVGTCPDRVEAFEDILWSLVNTTEFLNRK